MTQASSTDINKWATSAEKRALDVACLTTLAPILLPIGSLAVLASMPTFGKQVFFRHDRIGKDGSIFPVRKIRTMRTCSKDSVPSSGFNDDRATKLGKYLRYASIDEIPQLLSIASGKMSFVGPRVVMESDISALKEALSSSLFEEWQEIYFNSIPGGFSSGTIADRTLPPCNTTEERLIRRARMDIYDHRQAGPAYDFRLLVTGLTASRVSLVNVGDHSS